MPEPARTGLLGFLRYAAGTPLADLEQHCVDVFDMTGKCAMHLS